MTVCTNYFQGNPAFWISLTVSIILIGFLSLYLPFKKIKSKWKYAFIPLFIILLLIAIISNVVFLGLKDSCEGIWDRHLVKDYEMNITSIEEAKGIFEELAIEQFKDYPNQTQAKMEIEESLNHTWQNNDIYRISFGWNCYELHTKGELYSFFCGP